MVHRVVPDVIGFLLDKATGFRVLGFNFPSRSDLSIGARSHWHRSRQGTPNSDVTADLGYETCISPAAAKPMPSYFSESEPYAAKPGCPRSPDRAGFSLRKLYIS